MKLHKYQQAKKYVQDAISIFPQKIKGYSILVRILLKLGDKIKSLQFMAKMQELYKGDPEDCYCLTKCYFLLQDDKNYQKYLKEFTKIEPNYKVVSYSFENQSYQLNKIQQLERQFNKMIYQEDQSYLGHLGLGEISLYHKRNQMKSFFHLKSALNQAIQMKPKIIRRMGLQDYAFVLSTIYYYLGYAHLITKRFNEAVFYLKKSIEINPTNIDPVHYLGLSYRQLNLPDSQLQCYQQFQRLNPDKPDIFRQLADYYKYHCKHQQSLAYFQKMVNPQHSMHKFQGLGYYYRIMRQYEKSAQGYFKSINQDKCWTQSFIGLSRTYNQIDNNQKLKNMIIIFIKNLPNEAQPKDKIPYESFCKYLFFKLVGMQKQASSYFWNSISSIVQEQQKNRTLSLRSQKIVKKMVGVYICKGAIKASFLFDIFLTARILKYNQLVKVVFQKIVTYCTGQSMIKRVEAIYLALQEDYLYNIGREIWINLLQYSFEYSHQAGLAFYSHSAQIQPFRNSIGKYFQQFLLSELNKLKIVAQLQPLFQEDKYYQLKAQESQNSIIANFHHLFDLLKLFKSTISINKKLENFIESFFLNAEKRVQGKQIEQTHKDYIRKILRKIFKMFKIQWSNYSQILSKRASFFYSLKQYDQQIQKQAISIIVAYLKQRNVEQLVRRLRKILSQLTSQRSLKNQIVKLFCLNVYFPTFQHLQQLQSPIFHQIQLFLPQPNYHFMQFIDNIKKIINRDNTTTTYKNQLLQLKAYDTPQKAEDSTTLNSQNYSFQSSQQPSKMSKPQLIKFYTNRQDSDLYNRKIPKKDIHQGKYSFTNIKLKIEITKNTKAIYYEGQFLKQYLNLPITEKRQRLCFLLFKNTHHLMQYLLGQKQRNQYIARYYTCDKWQKQVVKQFAYWMDKSILPDEIKDYPQQNIDLIKKQINVANSTFQRQPLAQDVKIIQYIFNKGESQIAKILYCIANGILQLQKLNIFHGDIQFRNMVKLAFGDYKIMDFDIAFKYRQDCVDDACFENTLDLLYLMINYCPKQKNTKEQADLQADLQYIIDAIYPGLKEEDRQKIRRICYENQKDGVYKLRELLQKHATQFHRIQFKRLLTLLYLKPQKRGSQICQVDIQMTFQMARLIRSKQKEGQKYISRTYDNKNYLPH